MPRRVNLPGASELFRPTDAAGPRVEQRLDEGAPAPTGRVKHDQKITVYISEDELLALESARLEIRRLGVTADRGRIVRAAVALALADLAEQGADSPLVGRLRG